MKIKSKVWISAILSISLALIVGIILFLTVQKMDKARDRSTVAGEVVKGMAELEILTYDYLLHREERAQKQWQLKHNSVAKHMEGVAFKSLEKQTFLDKIRHNHDSIKGIFTQMTTDWEKRQGLGEAGIAVSQELNERLASRLLMKSQAIVSDAFQLQKAIQAKLVSTQQTGSLLIIVCVGILAVIMPATSAWMSVSVLKPIAELQEGTQIIGAGNLDYKVGTAAKDEVGQLSRAFDEMTGKLRKTTVSYDELAVEAINRKRAEEALRKAHDELEQRVEERTAELMTANQRLRREIRERTRAKEGQTRLRRRLEALWEVARMVDADYQTLCDRILVEIMDMTRSRYAFYGFLNEDESVMWVYSWSKEVLEQCQIQNKPIEYPITEAGLWADAVRERRRLIINDYQSEHPSKKGIPEGHVRLTRILVVPIFSYGRIVALAAVANKSSDYEEEDAREIEGFATNVQVILERQKMEGAIRESENQLRRLSSQLLSAQENERKSVAQDLHDSIGQTLAAIKFGTEKALGQLPKRASKKIRQPLEATIAMVQNGIEEVRRIQMALRPPTLDDLGVLATISWLCREFQTIYSGIRIEQRIDLQEDDVPEPLKTVIYRVMQEALNNIAKHSKADLVRLSLRKANGTTKLKIEDNGLGFDLEDVLSAESSKRGLGLSSMKERIELSGGFFAIESATGAGTIIRASWSLQ